MGNTSTLNVLDTESNITPESQETFTRLKCGMFCDDLLKSIHSNKEINWSFPPAFVNGSIGFNFLKCKEYQEIEHKIKKITYSPSDLTYPYNRYYTITSKDECVSISLGD